MRFGVWIGGSGPSFEPLTVSRDWIESVPELSVEPCRTASDLCFLIIAKRAVSARSSDDQGSVSSGTVSACMCMR